MGRTEDAIRKRLIELRRRNGEEIVRRRAWTDDEVEALMGGVKYGARRGQILNLRSLVEQMGRSEGAIRGKLLELGRREGIQVATSVWRDHEEEILLQAIRHGAGRVDTLHLEGLVKQLGRSQGAIQKRSIKLRRQEGMKIRAPWTTEEDEMLLSAMDERGNRTKSDIFQAMEKKLDRPHGSVEIRYQRIKHCTAVQIDTESNCTRKSQLEEIIYSNYLGEIESKDETDNKRKASNEFNHPAAPTRQHSYRYFTKAEDLHITKRIKEGFGWAQIARELDRAEASVHGRWKVLMRTSPTIAALVDNIEFNASNWIAKSSTADEDAFIIPRVAKEMIRPPSSVQNRWVQVPSERTMTKVWSDAEVRLLRLLVDTARELGRIVIPSAIASKMSCTTVEVERRLEALGWEPRQFERRDEGTSEPRINEMIAR
ncbi:hypothetical protein HDV00_012417 [Rhizophlyctis rosea]|nr:hypothetical protein HDV00_012417 [Rhizophlyctis rosea]